MVTGCDQRSLIQNKRTAFLRLARHPDFLKWAHLKATGVSFEMDQIKEKVENWLSPEFLKIEYF